jgi:hypothetical protein
LSGTPAAANGVIEPIVAPEQFAIDHEGWRIEDAKLPRTVGFGILKLLNVLTSREIEDTLGILPNIAGRCQMIVDTDPKITNCRCRVVKTLSGVTFAEFASVVDAVRCGSRSGGNI